MRRDIRGGAAIRATLSVCIVAMGFAAASPVFRTDPVVGKALGLVGELREAFPRALDKVTAAMRGR